MEFTVAEIAEMLSAEVVGNKDAVIKTVCKIEDGFEGGLSFLANLKYTNYIYDTKATAVLVNDTFVPEKEIKTTLIKVKDAYIAFATLLDFYNKMNSVKKGISKHAVIAESAKIGQNVYIAEFVSVGENAVVEDNARLFSHVCIGDNAKVGEDTVLNSGVKLYQDCVIGKNCIIHAGTVIGADGFGFASKDDESYMKVPQLGNVVIEDGVEIGANTCIDRATMGSTIIRKNVKLDNLIQIAHNVEIGENTVFAAQVGIAGSTKIGKNCMFGGQVGVNGHITIGDKVMIGAQSAVANSLEGGQILLGSPVSPIREEKILILYRKKLPELYKRVEQIEKKLKEI